MQPVATIRTDFKTKFGIPRQSNLIPELQARIVFLPEFSNPDVVRGMEDFSHLWLLWGFSGNKKKNWSATVRPPRLGGNERKGVFATRSPFRPNPVGLSVVALEQILWSEKEGLSLLVRGADLMDGSPIYDIKPYLPHIDSIPDARGGYALEKSSYELDVICPRELLKQIPEEKRTALRKVLSQDPRPSYQKDPKRIYGFSFAGYEVRFRVEEKTLTIVDVMPESQEGKKESLNKM